MSERTEISFDAALMMALRADAQKELDELPTPAQLKERYPDTSRWDARLKAALHKRCPVLKRVLVVARTLVILTLGALAVLTSSGNGIPDKLFLCLKLCRVGRKSFLFDFLLFLIQPPLCPILCLGHAHSRSEERRVGKEC